MLLGTLGASLLGNMLAEKWIVRTGSGKKKRKRNCKSWLWKIMGLLMRPHPLTNFEIQKYYQKESRFNGVYSRNILLEKIKDGAYIINLDEYAGTGTHCIALFCNRNKIVFSIVLVLNMFLKNFCIVFIDFMLAGKNCLILSAYFFLMTFKKMMI